MSAEITQYLFGAFIALGLVIGVSGTVLFVRYIDRANAAFKKVKELEGKLKAKARRRNRQ